MVRCFDGEQSSRTERREQQSVVRVLRDSVARFAGNAWARVVSVLCILLHNKCNTMFGVHLFQPRSLASIAVAEHREYIKGLSTWRATSALTTLASLYLPLVCLPLSLSLFRYTFILLSACLHIIVVIHTRVWFFFTNKDVARSSS